MSLLSRFLPKAEPVQTRAAQQTRTIARGQVLLMARLSEASKAQRPSALVFCPDCGRGSLLSQLYRGACPCCTCDLSSVPVCGRAA